MTDGLLTGRVGLVTGAGSGIGKACCYAATNAGAAVFGLDRDAVSMETLRADGLDGMVVDVTDLDQVEAAFAGCATRLGPVDFVVAAAGLSCEGTVASGDPTRWWPAIQTNVLGVMHTARVAFQQFAGRSGDLVVIGSVSGLETYVGEDIYVATKWAVTGLTESLRHEGRELGIRVVLVAPGLVDTPLARANPFARSLFATQGSALDTDDVARAVLFALSRPRHVALNEIVVRPQGQAAL